MALKEGALGLLRHHVPRNDSTNNSAMVQKRALLQNEQGFLYQVAFKRLLFINVIANPASLQRGGMKQSLAQTCLSVCGEGKACIQNQWEQ